MDLIGNIPIDDVIVKNRMRKDLGDIPNLAKSIQENGLINPLTLTEDLDNGLHIINLVTGHRRLEALKKLGVTELEHGVHFLWRQDLSTDEYRRTAVELEENIRRKQMDWAEEILGKQRLLQTYEKIYGAPKPGQPERGVQQGLKPAGFGVRKLAELLNENVSQTSVDLELAALITKIPVLKEAPTKEDARRKLASLVIGAIVQKAATIKITSNDATLYHGNFKTEILKVPDHSVDLVYVDLPYGVSLSDMSKHQGSNLSYTDQRNQIVSDLRDVAAQTYRILSNDRFAVFFFGFNYYTELVTLLGNAGLNVNPVPFIWYKGTNSTENPLLKYANSYDAAIVCHKGSPRFVRPGQRNFADIPPETAKIHIAQQPTALVTKFILDMTIAGNTVCDFMCGSGTTGEAALLNNRKVILIEQNDQSFNFVKSRIDNVLGRLNK